MFNPRERVLEVGTGSGYQTAILACLCQRLFSIERIKALYPGLRSVLRDEVAQCQGALWGWLRRMAGKCSIRWHIGYRRTARDTGCTDEQLAVGGRMVVPVGTDQSQLLKVIDRTDDGLTETISGSRTLRSLGQWYGYTLVSTLSVTDSCAKTNRHTDAQA